MDVQRYQNDLAAMTPGNQIQLFTAISIDRHLRNGYIATETLGIDHEIGGVKISAAYVGTAGIHLASVLSPNGYGGADPAFARYTQFDSAGHATGGFGPELVMSTGAHSSYHALQTSVSQSSSRTGLSFQASYTFSKSTDDTSAVPGGISGSPGVVLQTLPQNPFNWEADRGPSTFDVTHVFTLSLIQRLPLERVGFLRPLGKTVTKGWQVLNITTLTTGPPFTVYSGVQQTGAGAGGCARTTSGWARRTILSFRSPSMCRAGRVQIRAYSERWDATRFAVLAFATSTWRLLRTRRSAIAEKVSLPTFNFAQNFSTSSTKSTSVCHPIL
jgi:hypothetical protein